MSTRSLTTVQSNWDGGDWETHTVIYRHHDGYLEVHGQWLYEFLKAIKVTNGRMEGAVNGPGELAGALVAKLVKDGHNPNLHGKVEDMGQEYLYNIKVPFGMNVGPIQVEVITGPMTMFGQGGDECTKLDFSGTVKEYGEYLKAEALKE